MHILDVPSCSIRFDGKDFGQIFVASDTNFSMPQKLQGTPFKNVEDMDDQIIAKWNEVVNKNDIVLHTGNFGNLAIRERLNGQIYLIPGVQEYLDCGGPNKLVARFSITKDTKDLYEIPVPIGMDHDDDMTIYRQVERYKRLLKESFKFQDVLICGNNVLQYALAIKCIGCEDIFIISGIEASGKNKEYFSKSHLLYNANDDTFIYTMQTDIRLHNFTPINIGEIMFRGRKI